MKRFDREDNIRIHMEDFNQLYGQYPESKYERYSNMARDLAQLAGTEAVQELVRRIVFSAAIGNADISNLPIVNYGFVAGAVITNPGNCPNTSRLYVLVQDGVPVTYGMKFSNIVMSHAWDLETTGSTTYGEAWLSQSGNNTIIGEHPYTNQTIQIADYANANKHTNTFFDSPGEYGAAIYGPSGGFTNAVFSWDSASYVASSGYFFGAIASREVCEVK